MKQLRVQILVIAALGVLLANAGCIYNQCDLVITDKVCVDLHEVQTTGTFTSFVVCDQFKTELEQKLAENNLTTDDIKSIHMVGANFKVKSFKPHDWKITAQIDIARQDTPDGPYDDGPKPFTRFKKESLKDLKGDREEPKLYSDGVKLVDRALASLLDEEDPRLVLIINNEEIKPMPSPADPMEFTVNTCVKFQIVIKGQNNHGHHGGGGGGGGGGHH
ncbi:MAG TPA: hypothetical protein VFH33_09015 [Candidatus Krumholzibacteria bacterium]|nr:hypothetical protein [Candidatus Krumholzibacteria bacterium]